MASKRKIGATIALDGEKEFKSAVSSCNKPLCDEIGDGTWSRHRQPGTQIPWKA